MIADIKVKLSRTGRTLNVMSEDNLTVAEVSYKVGISDPFYFSKCFKAQFGVAPSVYQRGVNNEGINEKNE